MLLVVPKIAPGQTCHSILGSPIQYLSYNTPLPLYFYLSMISYFLVLILLLYYCMVTFYGYVCGYCYSDCTAPWSTVNVLFFLTC